MRSDEKPTLSMASFTGSFFFRGCAQVANIKAACSAFLDASDSVLFKTLHSRFRDWSNSEVTATTFTDAARFVAMKTLRATDDLMAFNAKMQNNDKRWKLLASYNHSLLVYLNYSSVKDLIVIVLFGRYLDFPFSHKFGLDQGGSLVKKGAEFTPPKLVGSQCGQIGDA